jgi:hypothetical protein
MRRILQYLYRFDQQPELKLTGKIPEGLNNDKDSFDHEDGNLVSDDLEDNQGPMDRQQSKNQSAGKTSAPKQTTKKIPHGHQSLLSHDDDPENKKTKTSDDSYQS